MKTFITGFPGFLASRLVNHLNQQKRVQSLLLLIQPPFMERARQKLDQMGIKNATLIPGDITAPDLRLERKQRLLIQRETERAYHLAALHDLSVPKVPAWRINVDGTSHVLDLLEKCKNLGLLGYASTAYVSGHRTGWILEKELFQKEGFLNYYEETKYHAELLIHERMNSIPTVIFRPPMVVGDTHSGATDKFDGFYPVIRLMRRLPPLALMFRIGKGNTPVNLVPVDYVIDAMIHIMQNKKNAGRVYHLTDSSPLNSGKLFQLIAHLLNKKIAFISTSHSFMRYAAHGWLPGISPQLIDYLNHPAHYNTDNTERALSGSGIIVPPFASYARAVIDFHAKYESRVRGAAMY